MATTATGFVDENTSPAQSASFNGPGYPLMLVLVVVNAPVVLLLCATLVE
ncbi:MAG: hypothetical protein IPK22_10005 [Verrucomicrobiaceae bacterium]|nr:hypothetical protein [Verrucomicrobiaceae bacterium]